MPERAEHHSVRPSANKALRVFLCVLCSDNLDGEDEEDDDGEVRGASALCATCAVGIALIAQCCSKQKQGGG